MTNEQYLAAALQRDSIANSNASQPEQPNLSLTDLKMTIVDKVAIVVGVAALAACAYRAYNGDTDAVLDSMWAGAKSGAKYGAIAGAVVGVAGGMTVGSMYGKGFECAAYLGIGTAIGGAIYGGVLGGALNGSGVYDSFNNTADFNTGINNDDLI